MLTATRNAAPWAWHGGEYLGQLRSDRVIDRAVLLTPHIAVPGAAEVLDRLDAAFAVHEAEIAERLWVHQVVDGHGDLRPEHVCLLDPPIVIDCLEFNTAMR